MPSTPVTGIFWQTTQPVSIAGTVTVDGSGVTQPVSGTFWQATQPVSIASMPITPVTGTFWQATQPVSGTFWQATQPVSATNLDIRDLTHISDSVKIGDGTDIADVLDLTNANPLAVAILDADGIQITSFGGGTQYREDVAAAADPIGTAVILVRDDTPGALVTTDGDNVAQRGTNYGAGYVQVVTSAGAFVDTFGGGTQYTEGDTDASITGTAALMEIAGDALAPIQGTVAGGLLVNLGANNDITLAILPDTAATDLALQTADLDTIAGDTTAIQTAIELLDNAVDGNYLNVNLNLAGTDVSATVPLPVRPNEYELTGNTTHVKKYYTNAGAVTDGIIWSPAAGKRWYVTDIFIGVSAASTVTLEDDLGAGDSAVWKMELAANSGWSHSFTTPLYSGEDVADLIITTTAGNVYCTVVGYEV